MGVFRSRKNCSVRSGDSGEVSRLTMIPAPIPLHRYSVIVYGRPASPCHLKTKLATPAAVRAARKLAMAPHRLARGQRMVMNQAMPIRGTVCQRKRMAAGMSVNRKEREIETEANMIEAVRLIRRRCRSLAEGLISRWWMLLV